MTSPYVQRFHISLGHNGRDGDSNHQHHECLLDRLFRRTSKKTSKLRVTGLCAGNSPVTGEFPAQNASNVENVSIWWRHHVPRGCRCEWDGQDCFASNMTKQVTDYGLCYTFNDEASIQLSTAKTGARFGLRLTLNIEQYEYMVGPNTDAGIKVRMC